MKMTKQKKLFYVSLGGTILFALLTFLILCVPSAPFILFRQWMPTGEFPIRGISFINGSLNEFNGIKVSCDAFVITTIILSALVIIASVLRIINISKYTKFISPAVISGLSILLMICVIVFFVKLGSFNNFGMMNSITVRYGIGAIIYLIFGLITALFAVSLFITDRTPPARQ